MSRVETGTPGGGGCDLVRGASAGAADGANAKGSKDKAPDVGEKRKRTKFTATQQVFGLLSCSRKSLTKAISILRRKDRRWLIFFPGTLEIILRGRSSTLGIATTRARILRLFRGYARPLRQKVLREKNLFPTSLSIIYGRVLPGTIDSSTPPPKVHPPP